MEELALFFEFTTSTKIPTIIYDGNHEATKKGKSFLPLLTDAVKAGNFKIKILDGIYEYEGIDFIPYTHIHSFNPTEFKNNILCTHVRGNIPPHVKSEIDLNKLSGWKIVLAGDLHSYENSQANVLYPGSPMTVTFHRKEVKNGIIVFDTETHKHTWHNLELPQLIRKTVTSSDEIIKTDYHHTIYEVRGNIADLSSIDTSSEVFDKKVVERNSMSTLSLHNISIREELEVYLKNVLNIDGKKLEGILATYDNYSATITMG